MSRKQSETIKGKRILVTGGAGSIGSELVRQLAPHNKIFVLDQNESDTMDLCTELQEDGHWVQPRIGDVRDRATVIDLFEDFKPQIIFHAAAYKHVPPLEIYPREAIMTNVIGTLNVLEEAKRWECVEKLVFISSDKAINSNSIMGATKKLGEIITKSAGYIAVRFGNVLGSRGSVLPIWQRQIRQGKDITVTDKRMMRYFMSIEDACKLVIEAATRGKGGEIFILDMGEQRSVYAFAEEIAANAGVKIRITGTRKGETLAEKLWLDDERPVKEGKFYIIR